MSLSYRIWDFPTLPVSSQVFHVPGMAIEGGYTSGGIRMLLPEPGGRAVLELQLSLQTKEWDNPSFSWLMSKTNGHIFRIPLTRTPQILTDQALGLSSLTVPWAAQGLYPEQVWDNDQPWQADGVGILAVTAALEGSRFVTVDMGTFGEVLKIGHVIGHGDNAYMIDEIEYDDNEALLTLNPPLRNDVIENDLIDFRPKFLGTISNGEEMKASYDASNVGHIQPGRILFREAIV